MNNTNCEDPATGIAKGTAFSIVFGLSFEKFNKTVPDKWMDEALSLLKENKESRYWSLYYTSSYGLSNEVERGTLTTLTKIVVSIILVMIMLVFAFYEDSYVTSIKLCRRSDILSRSPRHHGVLSHRQRHGTRLLAAGGTPVDDDHAGDSVFVDRTGCRQHGAADHSLLPRRQLALAEASRGARGGRGIAVQHDVDDHHRAGVPECV